MLCHSLPTRSVVFGAQAQAGSGRGLGAVGPGRQNLGPVLLAVLVALEKEQQGWDKAESEKCSGLERQGRDRDNGSAAVSGSAFP